MKARKKYSAVMTAFALALMLAAACPAFASAADVQTDSSSIVTQASITMQQASDIVTSANEGCTVDSISLKSENGTAVYQVRITKSDGSKAIVIVNAADGSIMQTIEPKDDPGDHPDDHGNCAEKLALKNQQQTLNANWVSYTEDQKEQVYQLKDAEFAAEIAKVQSDIAAEKLSQAQGDAIISVIQAKQSAMRTLGDPPRLHSIVELP